MRSQHGWLGQHRGTRAKRVSYVTAGSCPVCSTTWTGKLGLVTAARHAERTGHVVHATWTEVLELWPLHRRRKITAAVSPPPGQLIARALRGPR